MLDMKNKIGHYLEVYLDKYTNDCCARQIMGVTGNMYSVIMIYHWQKSYQVGDQKILNGCHGILVMNDS